MSRRVRTIKRWTAECVIDTPRPAILQSALAIVEGRMLRIERGRCYHWEHKIELPSGDDYVRLVDPASSRHGSITCTEFYRCFGINLTYPLYPHVARKRAQA